MNKHWFPALDPFLIASRHQVISSDLLTAPPHLPAKPLHLLQLHDGRRKEIIHKPLVVSSQCSASDLLFFSNFVPFQIQSDRPTIRTAVVFLLFISLKPTLYLFFPPSPQAGFKKSLSHISPFFSPHSPFSMEDLESTPFHFTSVTFAWRRLHSASYPFLKSPSKVSPVSPFFFSGHSWALFRLFLGGTKVRCFQLQSVKVWKHSSVQSNSADHCLFRKQASDNSFLLLLFSFLLHDRVPFLFGLALNFEKNPFLHQHFCCFSFSLHSTMSSIIFMFLCHLHSADCQLYESDCEKTIFPAPPGCFLPHSSSL